MPIRFRCAYCNQLLGISRRKAGTVVRCPTCSGQVVVPTLEEAGMEEKEEPAAAPGTAPSPLFEGNELDKLLEGAAGDQPSALPSAPPRPIVGPTTAASAGLADHASGMLPQPNLSTLAAGRPAGIFLSPARATLLSVLAVVALAIAFGAGLLVGWLVLAPGQ